MPPFYFLLALAILAVLLVVTAPWWSRLLARSGRYGQEQLEKAGEEAEKAFRGTKKSGSKEKSK